jgi:hypothetical protein
MAAKKIAFGTEAQKCDSGKIVRLADRYQGWSHCG